MSNSSSSSSSFAASAPSSFVVPSMLHFSGDKAVWATFKNRLHAFLAMQKLLEVLLHAGPAEAACAAAASKAAAAAAASGGATSSSTPPAPTPTQGPTEEQKELWAERSARVYAILVMCVQCPSLAMKINNVKFGDAHGVWRVLLERFERRTMHNLMQVTDQLHNAKLNPSDAAPLDMFVARIRSLELALTELGEPPSETKLKIVLLSGLPASYEGAAASLRVLPIDFDAMVTHLENHEESLRNQEKRKAEIDEIVSFARENRPHQQQRSGDRRSSHRGAGSRGGAGSGSQRLCYGCDQPGHVAFDCPKNRDAIKCSLCRTLGHADKQCQSTRHGRGARPNYRQKKPRDDDEDGHFAADPNDDEDGFACVVLDEALAAAAGLKPSSFLLDSGASIHLSNNKKKMRKMRRLDEPIRIRVADNTVMKLHEVGEMVVKLPGRRKLKLRHVAYHPKLATNLISVSRVTEAGLAVHFGSDRATINVSQADGSIGPLVCEAMRR